MQILTFSIPSQMITEIKILTLRESKKEYNSCKDPENVTKFWRQQVTKAPWYDSEKEMLVVLLLDSKLNVRSFNLVSMGIVNQTMLHVREVFRPAIVASAVHIILAHNHPSGNPEPSPDDIRATKDLVKAGAILGIPLLDHVIVGEESPECPKGFASLKESGVLS